MVSADDRLSIGGCDAGPPRVRHPLFVYDWDHLRPGCREAIVASGDGAWPSAAKASSATAMACLAHEEDMHIRRRQRR